ncbi:hypothetical protein ACG9YX_15850 [Acinetobacter nematophilus]|uniref:hypothetical protein n=1 Tax=Acinetobacter nematophilus TaxID=2994642 RepID=UPI003AF4EB7C
MFKIINTSLFLIACSPIMSFANQPSDALKKFVPHDWEILSQAKGDLNQDGKTDIALLIQPKNKHQHNRKLLVLFDKDQRPQLKFSQHIPNWTYHASEPCTDDALDDSSLRINHQRLELIFSSMSSCSNTYGLITTYRFKLNNSHFHLIGYDSFYLDKINGKQDEISINFLTHKAKLSTTANIFAEVDTPPEVIWKTVKSAKSYTLENIPWENEALMLNFSVQWIGEKQ